MTHSTTLHNAQQAKETLGRLWQWAKPRLIAGTKLKLTIAEETRSLDQNSKFHALCEDIARSGMEWQGKKRSRQDWKILLVSGHAVATKQGHEMLPGLEGEFVNLRESTASMSKARSSSLIEYTVAFCAANGVAMRYHAA